MLESTIIELDSIDSTNNYAMQLIDADKARHGLTIVAKSQTAGRGQRGKSWTGAPGDSLLMSIVVLPKAEIRAQFLFNAAVAAAIANVLRKFNTEWRVYIKWPNDIIVNDRKAGGLLIENVIRGSKWTHSVIGLGLNVRQDTLPDELPFATSLKIASGQDMDLEAVRDLIRENVLTAIALPGEKGLTAYNEYLYKRGEKQAFSDNNGLWEATLLRVNDDGTLTVQLEDGRIVSYYHGQVMWEWGAK